jgi:hypothetical protein
MTRGDTDAADETEWTHLLLYTPAHPRSTSPDDVVATPPGGHEATELASSLGSSPRGVAKIFLDRREEL